MVITKGADRIAEVAARFTLDSMPGKQMAIDADLSPGLINETWPAATQGTRARSDFFGAMDGASKFVRGDAVAGLIIVAINIVAGIIIGIVQHELSVADAAKTYTILSIGDGLVTQIPALLVSTAAGILVSKAGVEGSTDKALVGQLAHNPAALGVSAAAGCLPCRARACRCCRSGLALRAGRAAWEARRRENAERARPPRRPAGGRQEEPITTTLAIDEIRLELGYGLLALINDLKAAPDRPDPGPAPQACHRVRLRHAAGAHPRQHAPADPGYVIRIKEIESRARRLAARPPAGHGPARRPVDLPGEHVRSRPSACRPPGSTRPSRRGAHSAAIPSSIRRRC